MATIRILRCLLGKTGGGVTAVFELRYEISSLRASFCFLPFAFPLPLPASFPISPLFSPFLPSASSSSSLAPLAFLLPCPFLFTYSVSLPTSTRALSLLPLSCPTVPIGPGFVISSLPSAPLLALAFDVKIAGTTLLTICRACLARISLRMAGGAKPCDFSVRPMTLWPRTYF